MLPEFRMSEEGARWAFEVELRSLGWVVAFSNPTAGPWKTIKAAPETGGAPEEIYRFPREHRRPDIIAYSDTNRVVMILEAKGKLNDLLKHKQVVSTTTVFQEMSDLLSHNRGSWGARSEYSKVLGLLWSSSGKSESSLVSRLFKTYRSSTSPPPAPIYGIEICDLGARDIVINYYREGMKRSRRTLQSVFTLEEE